MFDGDSNNSRKNNLQPHCHQLSLPSVHVQHTACCTQKLTYPYPQASRRPAFFATPFQLSQQPRDIRQLCNYPHPGVVTRATGNACFSQHASLSTRTPQSPLPPPRTKSTTGNKHQAHDTFLLPSLQARRDTVAIYCTTSEQHTCPSSTPPPPRSRLAVIAPTPINTVAVQPPMLLSLHIQRTTPAVNSILTKHPTLEASYPPPPPTISHLLSLTTALEEQQLATTALPSLPSPHGQHTACCIQHLSQPAPQTSCPPLPPSLLQLSNNSSERDITTPAPLPPCPLLLHGRRTLLHLTASLTSFPPSPPFSYPFPKIPKPSKKLTIITSTRAVRATDNT